ncbi:type VI secretion protein (plasmid) [Cupriavidus pauculus]|uniref:Type VI secretion protein n=2 Tax=Cupriavidus pauculus TaxID=82633 RepID=A0A5P2HAG6_9BURK|nr:type VI secretion protein [Cupriavidus pauculus]
MTHTSHAPLPERELMFAHKPRIDLIRQYANESEATAFDAKWLAVLTACADWFGSMPLRPDEHAEPGGALRATVEAAYYAMRLSGAQKFGADQPSERRRLLEPQYLYALFLAAACSRLDEPCRHFQFFRDSDGQEWIPAAHGGFGVWLGDSTYQVRRREQSTPVERMRTALLAREILGAERLARFDPVVLSDLFGAINPDPRPAGVETLLHKVARQAVETVTQFEVKARRAAFSPDATPAPTAAALAAFGIKDQAQVSSIAPAIDDGGTKTVVASAQLPHAPAPTTEVAAIPHAEKPKASALPVDAVRPTAKAVAADPFAEALAGTSNLMRDFFRALSQDVAAGKTKVSWVENKLAISKRMIGNYGMASESLVENLRKFSLLYKVVGSDILLVDKVAGLIAERPVNSEGP